MKKLMFTLVFVFTISTVFTSCRDKKTPEENVESAMDDVQDEIEDASDDVQDAAEDLQEEIDEAAEETSDDN